MRKFISWLWGRSIVLYVQAIRRTNLNKARSGRLQYRLKAIVSGKVVCQMSLSAVFSPEQYENQLSKLLAKVYRRYAWLVRKVVYLPTIS